MNLELALQAALHVQQAFIVLLVKELLVKVGSVRKVLQPPNHALRVCTTMASEC
jgi:hypothetical protein